MRGNGWVLSKHLAEALAASQSSLHHGLEGSVVRALSELFEC
jgi:hypothetical protein